MSVSATAVGERSVPPIGRSELVALAALVCIFASAYALTGVFRHRHFDSSFDLAIFDQVIWHLSRFEAPASSIRGFANIFGDHFHPIIVLFVPFYWIVPAAETLIVTQALLFAASIVPVFLFLRQRLAIPSTIALCVAYGLFWGLQRAANFDVHEIAFAPVIIASAIYALDQKKWWLLCASCVLLVFTKEDLIPIIPVLGLYLAWSGDWKRGGLLMVSGLAAFFAVVRVVIPALSGGDQSNYAVEYVPLLREPWLIPARLVTPAAKLETALLWIAPFALMPLRSPLSILLVPLAFIRFLSMNPNHWGTSFHYSASVAPILAMSAGDGLARLVRSISDTARRRRVIAGVATASLVLSSLLPGRQPLWRLLTPKHYRATPVEQIGRQMFAMIPPDASVVAQAAILPHLSQRRDAYMLDSPTTDAEFIVTNGELNPWPLATNTEMSALVERWQKRGYSVFFEREGWLVLRHDSQPTR